MRGEGRGASGRLAAVHAAFIWRGKRHAEQRRPLLYALRTVGSQGARGVALRGLRGGAIVSVVRTGMAWSSLECWLFILSAIAFEPWASGVRVVRRRLQKAAVGQGRVYDGCVSEAPSGMWHGAG